MGATAKSLFEVTDHLEISGRGAFVIGRIRDGVFRVGMQVSTGGEPPALTISRVEYLDRVAERKFWNVLAFREHPTLEFLKRVFPIGALLEARDGAS